MTMETISSWQSGDAIDYVQPDIPEFEKPPLAGEYYDAMVPDTLDLAERARLAIHAMTENPNPAADYECYWYVSWVPTPRMSQDWDGLTITPKFREAVAPDRLICGSRQNLQVDHRWMEVTLHQQGADGLIYLPSSLVFRVMEINNAGDVKTDNKHQLSPYYNGQTLRNMSLYAALDGGEFWVERIRRLVDGLTSVTVDKGDYAFSWPGPTYAEKDRSADVLPIFHSSTMEDSGTSFGLLRAYRQTGYEPALALALACKLNTYLRATIFTADGAFTTPGKDTRRARMHGHMRSLLAMAEAALLTGDAETLEFVKASFAWGSAKADTISGWFPDLVDCPKWTAPPFPGEVSDRVHPAYLRSDLRGCETLGTASSIGLATMLSHAGVADHWDDVDRWVRNIMAESRLLETDWIAHVPGVPASTLDQPSEQGKVALNAGETDDRVAARNLGSWPTACVPNDWSHEDTELGFCFVHGDTAWMGRALYWVWNRILTWDNGRLTANLLLNRASPWADLHSYIPYQGRVEFKIKQAVDLAVRIPEWTAPADIRVRVGDTERSVTWSGRYAEVGRVAPDDTVNVTFPIAQTHDTVVIEKKKYALTRKGNDVIAIYPRGKYYPFYERRHYRDHEPRWRQVRRFVSAHQLDW